MQASGKIYWFPATGLRRFFAGTYADLHSLLTFDIVRSLWCVVGLQVAGYSFAGYELQVSGKSHWFPAAGLGQFFAGTYADLHSLLTFDLSHFTCPHPVYRTINYTL